MGEATPRYREIRGSLSKEICMSNTRRGVYSMNKLTCQHKSLPSVHTAPTWLRFRCVTLCGHLAADAGQAAFCKFIIYKGHKGGHHHARKGSRRSHSKHQILCPPTLLQPRHRCVLLITLEFQTLLHWPQIQMHSPHKMLSCLTG